MLEPLPPVCRELSPLTADSQQAEETSKVNHLVTSSVQGALHSRLSLRGTWVTHLSGKERCSGRNPEVGTGILRRYSDSVPDYNKTNIAIKQVVIF